MGFNDRFSTKIWFQSSDTGPDSDYADGFFVEFFDDNEFGWYGAWGMIDIDSVSIVDPDGADRKWS